MHHWNGARVAMVHRIHKVEHTPHGGKTYGCYGASCNCFKLKQINIYEGDTIRSVSRDFSTPRVEQFLFAIVAFVKVS